MNDHDIRLIEIGQKEGYDRAVKKIVAWFRDTSLRRYGSWHGIAADEIEAKFGERDAS